MNFLKSKNYKIENEIIIFENDDKTSKIISKFYQNNPFPNFNIGDNKFSLLKKGQENIFFNKLKNFIGLNKQILEAGCGTGQLSIFLSIGTNNKVISLDTTKQSLLIAKKFIDKNSIKNIKLINADILNDQLTENYFDFIICNGVLHHTKNAKVGFDILVKSLKKNGYIIVGLYNKYGRFKNSILKFFYRLLGKKFVQKYDTSYLNLKTDYSTKEAWIKDQYENPIESKHTIDEVLNWFDKNNIEYINSIPSCIFFDEYENFFFNRSKGNLITRIINQLLMIFNNLGNDGGIFIMVGKKL